MSQSVVVWVLGMADGGLAAEAGGLQWCFAVVAVHRRGGEEMARLGRFSEERINLWAT